MAALVAAVLLLARPRLTRSPGWRAALTPLASIIGSGFLVVVPLLAATVGAWAPLAMMAVVIYAFIVGWVLRINIIHTEGLLARASPPRRLVRLERLSEVALAVAYVVSVAFYLRLLATFVLRPFDLHGELAPQILTTALIVAIALIGVLRGLAGLEVVELVTVTFKLGVIAALLAGLVVFVVASPSALIDGYTSHPANEDAWNTVRILAGMLIVIQGFETSRYLGAHYSKERRATSMRRAQLIASVVYVAFAALAVAVFDELPGTVDETAILDIAVEIAAILGPLVLMGAVASQLSAAVADTVGGGGMLMSFSRAPEGRLGYVIVAVAAVVTVWLTDVFELITLASRAFATYYLLQALVAMVALWMLRDVPRRRPKLAALAIVAASLAGVVIFAIPVE